MPKPNYIALYMPVLHRGYMEFFKTFSDTTEVVVFDTDLLQRVDYIRKDLRALSPHEQVEVLNGLGRFKNCRAVSAADLPQLNTKDTHIVMPDEDISRALAAELPKAIITFHPVFLRWDRSSVEAVDANMADETITDDQFSQDTMRTALERAEVSSDIWRRVGAVLITEDKQTLGPLANQGEPTAHSPWMEGDPRNVFNRGVAIEMSLFMHAEAGLIAEAAQRGIATQGASLYVSTFPCPACAKLIAHSGITTCYYKDGYAVLDGADIMKEYGVKLVKVAMTNEPEADPAALVPYKK